MIGSIVSVPEGFGSLRREGEYYFLGRTADARRALLCSFEIASPNARSDRLEVHLHPIPSPLFEQAIEQGLIVLTDKTRTVPPWVAEVPKHALGRYQARHAKLTAKRRAAILPLVARADEILVHTRPFELIDRYARNHRPRLHEKRTRLWYFAYLCFGRHRDALLPAYCRAGSKNRAISPLAKKRGRKSRHGSSHGWPMTDEMHEAILRAYDKNRQVGKTLNDVYSDSMTHSFGCKARRNASEKYEFYQPDGLPFPTYWQYRYAIVKDRGKQALKGDLTGGKRVRRKSASKGSFASRIAYLMEKLEGDGYYVEELPQSAMTKKPLPPLNVVRLRDVLSGMPVGVGFALGAERADAYRMALFSMAIPKPLYCAMFGLTITRQEWPCEGFTPWLVVDRGPGAAKDLIKRCEDRIPFFTIAPSHSGQSKAIVEASHPRTHGETDAPSHLASNLSVVQLVRQELINTIRITERSDARRRMPIAQGPDLVTPIQVWRYYERLGRTHAYPVGLDWAVQNLLPECQFTACKDGVWLHEQRYDSPELRATGICDQVAARNARVKVTGYLLPLSPRQAWVLIDDNLVMVEALLSITADQNQLYVPLSVLRELHQTRSSEWGQLAESRPAMDAYYRGLLEDAIGKRDRRTLRAGRAKNKSPEAIAEVKAMNTLAGSRRK